MFYCGDVIMKNMIKVYVILVFSILLFNSCDGTGVTTVTVINKSFYDLHIKIDVISEYPYSAHLTGPDPDIIELKKNQSGSFQMSFFGPGTAPTPEEVITKITFSNLDTGVLIKILDKNIEKYFVLISLSGRGTEKAEYLLEITNDLLQ